MQTFSRLNKIFWRLMFARMNLIFLVVSFFLLLTIFAGAVLVMDYNWSMLMAAVVCLSPWLLAIIISSIVLRIDRRKYERAKHELLENGRMALISRVITLAIQYFLSRRKKATSEHE